MAINIDFEERFKQCMIIEGMHFRVLILPIETWSLDGQVVGLQPMLDLI